MIERDTPRNRPSTLGTLVFIMWGLIGWGGQLTAIYIGHTWACALSLPANATDMLAAVLTAGAFAAVLPVAVIPARIARLPRLGSDDNGFHVAWISRVIALLSLVAIVWTGMTALFIESCLLSR